MLNIDTEKSLELDWFIVNICIDSIILNELFGPENFAPVSLLNKVD